MRISDWSSDVCSSDLNGRALVKAAGRGRNACTRRTLFKLLHAQRNALLLDIDVENDCLDDFTLAMEVKRVFAGDSPCDVRHVDHAIDVAVETNEQAEFSGVLDFAFRSEVHPSELHSLMRISYAVFCLKK